MKTNESEGAFLGGDEPGVLGSETTVPLQAGVAPVGEE